MKYEKFIVRDINKDFHICKGYRLEEDNSLACVRYDFDGRPRYIILDIASGLSVVSGWTKKSCFEKWEERKEEFKPRIIQARKRDFYLTNVEYAENVRRLLKQKGEL